MTATVNTVRKAFYPQFRMTCPLQVILHLHIKPRVDSSLQGNPRNYIEIKFARIWSCEATHARISLDMQCQSQSAHAGLSCLTFVSWRTLEET